jgi:hypothetical protein
MADIVSIEIIPDPAILFLGTSQQYQALATYDDGAVEDVTDLVDWSVSGSPAIGVFDTTTKGLFLPSGVGTGTVYVSEISESHILHENDDNLVIEEGDQVITESATSSTIYSSDITIINPLVIVQEDDQNAYNPTVQSYLDLITSQYQNSPKYLHWIRTYLEMVMDIRRLANSLMCYFSFNRIIDPDAGYIENAWTIREDVDFTFFNFEACVGDQLDILGVILGQSRNVYFKAEPFSSPPVDARNVTLDDDTYRILLKSRIYFNHWDGKAQSLQEKWSQLFVGGVITIVDNQDMSMDVLITGAMDETIVDLIQNDYIIPRPQGVQINYYYGTMPFFGFDRQDDYIAGFDTGNWV